MSIWYLLRWGVDKLSLFKKSKSPFIYILDWKEAARNLLLFYITMNYHSYSNVKLVRTTQSIRPKMSRFESHAIDNLAGRPTEKTLTCKIKEKVIVLFFSYGKVVDIGYIINRDNWTRVPSLFTWKEYKLHERKKDNTHSLSQHN